MGAAIFSGVSGLQGQQAKLDVIGNNIANVNTTGYRGARVLFQDLFSQTLQGASGGTAATSGTNPQQVGLGVRIGTIDTDYTQGSLLTTNVLSDLAIQGDGFFVVSDANQTQNFFTRDGSFLIDRDGFLVDPATGLYAQGFTAVSGVVDPNGPYGQLSIPLGGASTAAATTAAALVGNLDPATPLTSTLQRTITVYDSLGTPVDVTLDFVRTGPGAWTWDVSAVSAGTNTTPAGNVLTFDSDGQVLAGSPGTITITTYANGAADSSISVDFSGMSQLSGDTSVAVLSQDGFTQGTLESFSIGTSGMITGVYSNGLTETLGQVALATFSNPGGLSREGSNLFATTINSGSARIGSPNDRDRGSIVGGALEGSNVDLATEFANMILAQRAFQANARTVTTADLILNETVNLVR